MCVCVCVFDGECVCVCLMESVIYRRESSNQLKAVLAELFSYKESSE